MLSLLFEFASMWDGSLGKITTVKHHVDPHPDSRPALQHPYRARLKKKELEIQEIDRRLKEA